MMNIDEARCYATEANLLKALAKFGFDKCRYMIVCNRSGKFTAIFSISLNSEFVGGNLTMFARQGFITFA